jgi:hypothetical protein
MIIGNTVGGQRDGTTAAKKTIDFAGWAEDWRPLADGKTDSLLAAAWRCVGGVGSVAGRSALDQRMGRLGLVVGIQLIRAADLRLDPHHGQLWRQRAHRMGGSA